MIINYKYSDDIEIKNNFLKINLKNKDIMDIFPEFLDKMKDKFPECQIYYDGDSPYIKENFFTEKDKTTIFLRPYTYLIKSEYIKDTFISRIFKERGNWQEYQAGDDIDFMLVEGDKYNKDKKLYMDCFIKNMVDRESILIIKKDSLFKAVTPALRESFLHKQIAFKLSPSFRITDKFEQFFKKCPIGILKPVDGYGGKEITIIKGYEHFKKVLSKIISEKRKDKWSDKRRKFNDWINKLDWVLEEYLLKPNLFEGKKYHFRAYFIYYQEGDIKKSYLFHKFRIAPAEEKYSLTDFSNKKIHDTHYVVKDKINVIYLDDFLGDRYADIKEQLIILFSDISKHMDTRCYKESKMCYQVFAADLMITDDYQVKLLEINNQPGFNLELNTSGLILENVMFHIIDKIFPPEEAIEDPGMFIPLVEEGRRMTSRGVISTQESFIDSVARVWHSEGYGPKAKKDKTGGYYLECGGVNSNFHIHIVGPRGGYHKNSWSRKGEKKRLWVPLDFRVTAKEQAYYIYSKSGYRNHKNCTDYYQKHKK